MTHENFLNCDLQQPHNFLQTQKHTAGIVYISRCTSELKHAYQTQRYVPCPHWVNTILYICLLLPTVENQIPCPGHEEPWKGRISLLVPSIFLYCASENYVCFRNNIFHFSFKIQIISSLCWDAASYHKLSAWRESEECWLVQVPAEPGFTKHISSPTNEQATLHTAWYGCSTAQSDRGNI